MAVSSQVLTTIFVWREPRSLEMDWLPEVEGRRTRVEVRVPRSPVTRSSTKYRTGVQYTLPMSTVTAESVSLREAIAVHRDAVDTVLRRYQAVNPRLFGSVARGDATTSSDIDLLVDLLPGDGNDLLRVAGVAEELSQLLGTRVDVVAESLLRDEVSSSALTDSVAL